MIEQIVFDLDDTLLDTYRQLVPKATRDACLAMIKEGLATDLETALKACAEREMKKPRHDLFTSLVSRFGIREGADPLKVAGAGSQAFYNRKVETDIQLFPGTRELLGELREKGYPLHLVTQGHRPTQEEKIRILGLEPYFDSIHHVDPKQGERKRDAFSRVMARTKLTPMSYLSVGNRIDTDIAEAKELGWQTCWLRYGEYKHMTPTLPLERPDYTIENLKELPQKCQL